MVRAGTLRVVSENVLFGIIIGTMKRYRLNDTSESIEWVTVEEQLVTGCSLLFPEAY